MTSSASSNRATRWSNGTPNARCSGSCHPHPRPRISLPPATASSVAAIFANTAGCRKLVANTSDPSPTRSVAAATAARIVNASWIPSSGSSGIRNSRWSYTQTLSIPAASARSAASRITGHPPAPGSSASPIGSRSPTRRGVVEVMAAS